jgi:hypothetical protein
MSWPTAFPQPIVLKDGRVLAQLGEAGQFILRLPQNQQDTLVWRYAAALLIKASHTELPADIFMAMMQMRRALLTGGYL